MSAASLKGCIRHYSLTRSARTAQHLACRTFSSFTLHWPSLPAPTVDVYDAPVQTSDTREFLKTQKFKDLMHVLSHNPANPRRVWACYLDLLNFVRLGNVPLEVHQKVLRRSTYPASQARVEFAKRLMNGSRPRYSHIHEVRFQSIIHNIREAGYIPSLDDYHFILEQFAAVGHHLGALRVLQEITYFGFPKTPKTYGLCLQSLCHRLKLPCYHDFRPKLLAETSKICMKLLNEMWASNVPFTSVNIDLSIRVLKETLDLEVLEKLLKVAYGVDLAFPDRPPLEFWEQGRVKDAQTDGDLASHFPGPQPFSMAALNTTIDVLGRLGNISKLVQAFEVLTTPLPTHAPAVPSSSFYDDEDDDFGYSSPSVAPYSHPHARPNSTTFYMLLKWVSSSGNAALARHYLLHAMSYDREMDRRLRGDCLIKPRQEIHSLHFAVNRSMILPVFAEANRDKNMELMRWVLVKIRRVLRRKRADILYYTGIREAWQADESSESLASDRVGETPESVDQETISSPQPSKREGKDTSMPHFDVDLDAPATPAPREDKIFDIDVHLSILDRDKAALEELEKNVVDVVGRTSQRIKERLGRRIWGQKDIFLRIQNNRTRVSRDIWREVVNFRSDRVVPLQRTRRDRPPHLTSKSTARRPERVISAADV